MSFVIIHTKRCDKEKGIVGCSSWVVITVFFSTPKQNFKKTKNLKKLLS